MYRIDHDEVLDVFVHGCSGVFKVRVKSVTLGCEFNKMVSNTTGIPTYLYKLFDKNQVLDLNSPIGKQLSHACSIVLHVLEKVAVVEIIQIDKVCIAVLPFAPIDFLMERVLLRKLLNKQIISIRETFKGASKKI